MNGKYHSPEPWATEQDIASLTNMIIKFFKLKDGEDLEPFVKRLNGEINYQPIGKNDSASITVEKDGKFQIHLPQMLFPLRERLYIAHELAHLFLHFYFKRGTKKVPLIAHHNGLGEAERVEHEANVFARMFLMPANSITSVASKFNNDISSMATYFKVPEAIVRQRMDDIDVCSKVSYEN